MNVVTYKLFNKTPNKIQIKEGRKVKGEIIKVNDGWYCSSRVFPCLQSAIEYFKSSSEQILNAFGNRTTVVIHQ